jgi:DNA adenine methylase
MPTYSCDNCETVFEQKSHYDKHKARKTPCKKAIPYSKPVVKPFLKWVGGKTQILDDVLEQIPNEINNYYEPFLGGGSVLLAVLSKKKIHGTIYASDVNEKTVALFKNIQTNLDEFLNELKKLVDTYNSIEIMNEENEKRKVNTKPTEEESKKTKEHYYYYIRNLYNSFEDKTDAEASAILLFLNKTCFRGVYREGPHGFNVPFGHNKNVGIYDEEHLKEVSKLIKDVEFSSCSFEVALESVKEGDFVYLDPPYAPENDTSFVGYVVDGFDLDKHNQLFKLMKEIKGKFLMSNADVKLVKDAFPEPYKTKIISARRAINSKNPEAKTNEVLISN